MKKAKLWAHATYEMVEHGDFSKRLNLPAYVRAENYDFIYQRCENMEAENARLKAEVERLTACGYHRNFDFSVEHLTRLFKDGKIAEVSYEGERSQWYCADAYARCVNAEIEAKRLKAEVERLRKAGEWQPIETAPKDMTRVLGYVEEYIVVMWWFTYSNGRSCWETVDGESEVDPTHWMPLPKPPQEGKPSV